ncbi:MAG: hypothetical protein GX661_03335 [Acholeplasmataceae bacterium]|nr:hypothetical protein [Acholeplasmataceae bacterium]
MNRLVKRYIILFFVVLIPLLLTYLVGSYGYKSEKFGQGKWLDEYEKEYMSFSEEATTSEKINKYLKYGINTQYYIYNATPVYSEVITADNKALFTLKIYQTIYKIPIGNNTEADRIQYLFVIYDVQYQNIRDSFYDDPNSTLGKDINKTNLPTFTIDFSEVLPADSEETPKTKSVTISSINSILDEGADFDTVSGKVLDEDETTTETRLYVVLGTVNMDDLTWSETTKVVIKAKVTGVKDEEDKDVTNELLSFEQDFDVRAGDTDEFEASYQRDIRGTGYLGWVIRHYLWWICLITFVAIGLITASFYGVYLAEEYQSQVKKNTKAKVKK